MEISKHQAATSRPILPLKLQGLGLTPEYPFLLSTEVNKPHHHQIHPTKHHHCSNTISLTVLHHVIIIQSATQAKSQQPPEPHHQTNKQQPRSKYPRLLAFPAIILKTMTRTNRREEE